MHAVAEVTQLFCHPIGVSNVGKIEEEITDFVSQSSDYQCYKKSNKDAVENEGDHKTRLTLAGWGGQLTTVSTLSFKARLKQPPWGTLCNLSQHLLETSANRPNLTGTRSAILRSLKTLSAVRRHSISTLRRLEPAESSQIQIREFQ